MTEKFVCADAHAYVDNSLSPVDRRAFEARLGEDAELRRRVDLWLAQNEALRLAYGAPTRSRGPLSLGRTANENPAPRAPTDLGSRRVGVAKLARGAEEPKAARSAAATRRSPSGKCLAAVACLALVGLCLSAWGGPMDPRDSLIDVGASAYRAFGGASTAPMDYATDDPRALSRWLAPRFLPAAYAGNLEIPGWRLLGARVVSGMSAGAAFIAYVNAAGERAGLLIEPLDAPPDWAPGAREIGPVVVASETLGGSGVAAVGPSAGFVAVVMRAWDPAVARAAPIRGRGSLAATATRLQRVKNSHDSRDRRSRSRNVRPA